MSPRSRIHTGVVGVELPGCSDEIVTLIKNLVALVPGTMPIDLTSDPTVLYVHVLHLEDVEVVRRDILRLTDLAVRAFGSPDAVAAQDELLAAGAMIAAAYLLLGVRRSSSPAGPSSDRPSSDRVIGIDGVIVSGMSIIIVNAMDTGRGAFLPAAVVLALVSFVSTSVVARYIERRGE